MQTEDKAELQVSRVNIVFGITYILLPGIAGIIWSIKELIILQLVFWIVLQVATSSEQFHERTGY